MDLKEQELLGGHPSDHWYYALKGEALLRLLGDRCHGTIVDVGAGSGFFSELLLNRSQAETSVCIDPGYESTTSKFVNGKEIRFIRQGGPQNPNVVLMLDVLEHVEDDVGLLTEYLSIANESTWFAISVPAFNFMWSGHDEFLGHYRRYTLSSLEQAVTAAKLEVVESCYFFGTVFPLAAGIRLLGKMTPGKPASQLRPHSRFVDGALRMLSAPELRLFRSNRAFGLSVFCLAKARSQHAS